MPAPHHSVFLKAGCPSCHPTNSIKALKHIKYLSNRYLMFGVSTTAENPGNLLEFEIAHGNTGNLLEFS